MAAMALPYVPRPMCLNPPTGKEDRSDNDTQFLLAAPSVLHHSREVTRTKGSRGPAGASVSGATLKGWLRACGYNEVCDD